MKTSPRTINHFTGTDGKQFYAFEGKGFDQAHPKSNPTHMDKRNYRMNIFNGRLYEGNFYQSLKTMTVNGNISGSRVDTKSTFDKN